MSLLAIKSYMQQVKTASLAGLCQIFNRDVETVRCLLSHWINKGKMRQCKKTPACGTSCTQCPVAMIEIYEWVN